MAAETTDCDLCKAYPGRKEIGPFFVLNCKTCKDNPPMLVLREHRGKLTMLETEEFLRVVYQHFPGNKPRGWGMRSITDHWHEHLVPK